MQLSSLRLVPVPMFNDNYLWLLIAPNGNTVAVDVGDYDVLDAYLQAHQLTLTTVLITHHHRDHTAGLPELKKKHPDVPIYGSATITGITHVVNGGDIFTIADIGRLLVLDISGHTKIHLAFYQLTEKILFCSDCLFSAGCGRIFDGDPVSFYQSIQKISLLADDTRLCAAHEYTLSNLEFALAVEPNNIAMQKHQQRCTVLRQQNQPTLPTRLGNEKRYNPFLRCHLLSQRIHLLTGEPCENGQQAFTALRRYKNTWQAETLVK